MKPITWANAKFSCPIQGTPISRVQRACRAAGWLLAAALLLATAPQGALAQQERPMTQEEILAYLDLADSYLNEIDRLRGRFIQVSSDGSTAEGVFFVNRPGKLRFDYDPPVPILMLADDGTFVYYDEELEEATLIPLWSTPLWFLLDEETKLNDRVIVRHITQTQNRVIYTMVDRDGQQDGELDLVFGRDPFELKQWVVRDNHGVETEVTLVGMQAGVDINDDVFDWHDLPGANTIERLQNNRR